MRHERFAWGIELLSRGWDFGTMDADYNLVGPIFNQYISGQEFTEERNKLFEEMRARVTEKVKQLIELRLSQKDEERLTWYWIKNPKKFDSRLFVDDHCTMGVFHPETPVELVDLMKNQATTPFEVVQWILDYEEGRVERGGTVAGQDPANTCPKCGGFLASGATRRSIFYSCEACGYSNREDNLTDPCPR